MIQGREDILRLMNRILSGEASDEDIREYNQWCRSFQEKDLPVPYSQEITEEMLDRINDGIYGAVEKPHFIKAWKVAAAAVVFIALGIGGYYFLKEPVKEKGLAVQPVLNDVDPGRNKATLTLANGQTIILDSVRIGQLANQGSSKILKSDSGQLTYNAGALQSDQMEVQYNTLSVPKGGQYRLVLPDGTKAWINAASSVRYPTAFAGEERRIEITGEVYLEVAKDAHKPFIVSTRNSEIKVLGTHFNVMAYEEESAVKTTLLEGSVSVSVPGSKEAVVIKPGQQAAVSNADQKIEVEKVNAADVAAWTQGLLSLRDCTVQEFMNQLSRWYNVEVRYEDQVPEKRFGGMINRNAKLSDVLGALDAAGIHTKMESDEIVVLSGKSVQ